MYPKNLHTNLHEAQGGLCHYCKQRMFLFEPCDYRRRCTVDHRQPLARGGTNAESNLVGACYECNNLKGSIPEAIFFELMEKSGGSKALLRDLCAVQLNPNCAIAFRLWRTRRESVLDQAWRKILNAGVAQYENSCSRGDHVI